MEIHENQQSRLMLLTDNFLHETFKWEDNSLYWIICEDGYCCWIFAQCIARFSPPTQKAWLAETHSVLISRLVAPMATILWFPFLLSHPALAKHAISIHWDTSAWPLCAACILCIVMKKGGNREVNKTWSRLCIQRTPQCCALHSSTHSKIQNTERWKTGMSMQSGTSCRKKLS